MKRLITISLAVILIGVLPGAAESPNKVLSVDQPAVARNVTAPTAATLDQAPDQSNGIFTDQGCSICGTGVQTIAEHFVVSTGGAGFPLNQIVLWGGYYSTDTAVATDSFEISVHQDNAGLPGTVVCSENAVVPTSRTATGMTLFGVSEYIYTIDLAATCNLPDGTYWIQLYNDTSSITDDFFWEAGALDATNGLAGSVWATEIPAVTWNTDSATNLAVQLSDTVAPVEIQAFSVE